MREFLLPALVFCLSPLLVMAQDSHVPHIIESFTVSATTVEVVVEDKNGNRVHGLSKDDFALFLNKRPQNIAQFEEVRLDLSDAAVDESSPDMPALTESPKGRDFLVFVDDWFTVRKYRSALLKRVRNNLSSMGLHDRMAIVRYDGARLSVLTHWTNRQDDLGEILDKLFKKKTREGLRRAKLESRGSGRWKELIRQIKTTAESIEIGMRAFSVSNNRKMLLLVTTGYPFQFGFREPGDGPHQAMRFTGNIRLLRPITDTANSLGYTIFPMGISAAKGLSIAASQSRPRREGFNYVLEKQWASLRFLADETGGIFLNKSFVNKQPLGEIVQDSASYYQLVFSAGNYQSRRANIEVKIPGTPYKVRYRKDFRTRSGAERDDVVAEAGLLLGFAANTLAVTFGQPRKTKFRKLMLPVDIRIPMGDLVGFEQKGKHMFSLELRVVVEDKKGYRSELANLPVVISGRKPKAGEYASYKVDLELRKLNHVIVFTLKDKVSGKTMLARIPFDPKAHKPAS